MSNIQEVLVYAQQEYNHITASQEFIELTDVFPQLPKTYHGAEKILAYAAAGHPFTTKYRTDKKHPTIKKFGPEQELMAALCLKPIMNTTLHEVADYLYAYPDMNVQGWNTNTLEAIHDKLRSEYDGFDIHTDTAFIFAGNTHTKSTAALQRHWLLRTTHAGVDALTEMNDHEAALMETVLPEDVLAGKQIAENSYMHGREIHTESSVQFLEAKVRAYDKHRTLR